MKIKKIPHGLSPLYLNKLNNERNEAFLKEYKSFEDNLTLALKNNNYDELMKLVPGKMILKSVAKIFGLDEQTYIRQIFIRIKQKEDLKAELRKYII